MSRLVINESFLQEVEKLQMLLKNNLAGQFGGNRQTKAFGSSCEFADYRDYIPGDDVTKIDWNVYARTEKLYQKLYLDERQMHTKIYVDASRSMEHGKGEKADQALRIAAAFAYLSVCDMDRVSVYAIHNDRIETVISGMVGKDSYLTMINKLNEIEFCDDSFISSAVMPTNVGRGDGMSIVISDFLTDNNFEDAIHHMADKKRDVLCVQILTREEIKPQIRGKSFLFDSENVSKTYKRNIDREIVQAYKQALEFTIGRIRDLCASRDADYMLVRADEPVSDLIFGKLVDAGVLK